MKQHLGWIIAAAGTILLLFILVQLGGNATSPSSSGGVLGGAAKLAEAVHDNDNAKGNLIAPVTLVEYSDFQCPACQSFSPVIDQLLIDFPEDIQIVFRHFPLRSSHPNAQLAGQAAEAAANQGKFWDMHDMLFNTQSTWARDTDPTAFFVQLAGSLDLDIEQFKADLTSTEVRDRVNEDYNFGTRSAVRGTPSLFLNGEKIDNPSSYEDLANQVHALIQAQ